MSTIGDIVAGSGAVIMIETEVSGPQTVATRQGSANPLVGFLKPKVTVLGSNGAELVSVAPYGEPDAKKRLAKQGAIVIGLALLVGGIFWLGRKSK